MKKSPFFENLKNINPTYCNVIVNDAARKASKKLDYCQKSQTFVEDKKEKLSVWKGLSRGQRLDCNKENDLEIVDEHKSENGISPTHHIIPTDHTKTLLNVLNVESDGNVFDGPDTETCNDDIVIFERTPYKCRKVDRVEDTQNIRRSVNVQKVFNVLRICFIILLLTSAIFCTTVAPTFLNYFKVKTQRQPTNYEVSLLLIKNVGRLISSGVDIVRNVW